MKCKDARRALVLDLYGELAAAEKTILAAHLGTCPGCAAEREETLRLFALLETGSPARVPAADKERVWKRIESGLKGRPPRTVPFGRRWSFAGAGLILVLAVGIFIGRFIFTPAVPPASEPTASRSAAAMKPVLAGHLDDLKPLLLEFANAGSGDEAGRTITVEEATVRSLLLQNVLLRQALLKTDPASAEFLDDMDLILREIINRGRPTSASPAVIGDLIRKRDVLFKLEILKKT